MKYKGMITTREKIAKANKINTACKKQKSGGVCVLSIRWTEANTFEKLKKKIMVATTWSNNVYIADNKSIYKYIYMRLNKDNIYNNNSCKCSNQHNEYQGHCNC